MNNTDALKIVQELLSRCRGNIENVEQKSFYENHFPFLKQFNDSSLHQAYVTESMRAYVKVNCDLELLAKELCEYYEIKDIMRDPETRQLIQEARFINRLKRGKYGDY
jgi:hypothetical protein